MSFHRNLWLLLGTILLGFVTLSIVIAIAPAYWVQAEVELQDSRKPLSALAQRGLAVYISEGCVACHTQQVRPLKMDAVWGRPSSPGDYAKLEPIDALRPYAPAVLGTARIGPDLSDVGDRQSSEAWHYLHLYNPRSVVKASIMPAYPWLFDITSHPGSDATIVPVPPPYAPAKGKVVPNERGQALVAYLLSLRQPALSAAASMPRAKATEHASAVNRVSGPSGATLYGNNCASCHQATGQGVPGVFPPLVNDSVVTSGDPTQHIDTVLNGLHGKTINGKTYASPMPSFASQLTDADLAAILNHERTSWGNHAPAVTADDVARRRKGGN